MRHLKKLLTEKYVDNGVEPFAAAESAERAIRILVAAEAIPQARAESWGRDAQIYYLRGNNVPFSVIQSSYNISRSLLYDAINRHGKRRKAASKV
jgi:hypothetical protein